MRALLVLFKIYLVLWVVFRGFTLGTRLLFGFQPQNAVFFALGIVGFVPLVGFLLDKPILKRDVWRVWLVFLLVWVLFDRTFYSGWFFQPPFDGQFFGVLLAVPSFAAVYSYTRPTFNAWTAVDPSTRAMDRS